MTGGDRHGHATLTIVTCSLGLSVLSGPAATTEINVVDDAGLGADVRRGDLIKSVQQSAVDLCILPNGADGNDTIRHPVVGVPHNQSALRRGQWDTALAAVVAILKRFFGGGGSDEHNVLEVVLRVPAAPDGRRPTIRNAGSMILGRTGRQSAVQAERAGRLFQGASREQRPQHDVADVPPDVAATLNAARNGGLTQTPWTSPATPVGQGAPNLAPDAQTDADAGDERPADPNLAYRLRFAVGDFSLQTDGVGDTTGVSFTITALSDHRAQMLDQHCGFHRPSPRRCQVKPAGAPADWTGRIFLDERDIGDTDQWAAVDSWVQLYIQAVDLETAPSG